MNEHDDFELKRRLDALPRSIEPPEDLWPAVRGRLQPRLAVRPWSRPGIRIAALLALLTVSAGALVLQRQNAATWRVTTGTDSRRLAVGESLATTNGTARVKVGTIGELEVDPGTRVRLIAAGWSEQRLALSRGTIHAEISAPPRLFVVETPSGTAIDLGCAYTLEVDSAGNSTIRVTAGWVSFEDHGRTSLIPQGMRAASRLFGGIGTPYRDNAPDSLRIAIEQFDHAGGDAAVDRVLRLVSPGDAVTLWHLLQRTGGPTRERVADRLFAIVPLPADIPRAAILQLDSHAMQLYWTKLPGTLPIVPGWQQKLWKFWLRVFG